MGFVGNARRDVGEIKERSLLILGGVKQCVCCFNEVTKSFVELLLWFNKTKYMITLKDCLNFSSRNV